MNKYTENNTEVWRPIEESNGKYSISSLGRVMFHNLHKSTRKYYKPSWDSKIKKQFHFKIGYAAGYMAIGLTINGKLRTRYIHRLMAQAFIPNPNNYSQVNHINGNSLDNRIENLEWCTPRQNINHAWDNGLVKRDATRITADIINSVRLMSQNGITQRMISETLNIGQSNISRIIHKKRNFI